MSQEIHNTMRGHKEEMLKNMKEKASKKGMEKDKTLIINTTRNHFIYFIEIKDSVRA